MTFVQFIRDYAPAFCMVNPSFGVIAEMVFEKEKAGEPAFESKHFKNARERAKLVLPYPADNKANYNICLDVVEMAILNHRQREHGEDNSLRLAQLEASNIPAEIKEVGTRDWWSN